jgi:penicillin amidase
MLPTLIAALSITSGVIVRGPYGEPHIFAANAAEAYRAAGLAVAQDRLWQMELSRRSSRGTLAEVLGKQAIGSDTDAIRFGYTASEYESMFSQLPETARTALRSYAEGINAAISEAKAAGKLPSQFTYDPTPWTETDSMAIAVNLIRRFGRGGAGEIRNLLLHAYLTDRLKERTADVMQDLLWQNDAASIPTVSPADEPRERRPPFPKPSDSVFRSHLALMPKVNMLELLPAIRLERQTDMADMAAQIGAPFKAGSYALVVSKKKSATGVPLLLNGPQMGFSAPSVVHMMSIDYPGYSAVGADVPGLPGILVGHSDTVAWGLTSGVADTDDIFVVKLNPANQAQYQHGEGFKDFERVATQIKVRGGEGVTAVREMSVYGPVVIKSVSTGVAYVRNSTQWMTEVGDYARGASIAQLKDVAEARTLAEKMSASFNLFLAFSKGDIAWFYCARVPRRAKDVDPRLPTPGDGKHDWAGTVPGSEMPYVINPKNGLIANWNNKPAAWWPNGDTPIWGRIFRNETLLDSLAEHAKVSAQDIEASARYIAMHRNEYKYFLKDMLAALPATLSDPIQDAAARYLRNWKGDYVEGSPAPVIYEAWFDSVREMIFAPKLGTFLSAANFKLIVQPTFVWNALHKKTRYDYVAGVDVPVVYRKAFDAACKTLLGRLGNNVASWDFVAGRISLAGLPSVLYNDRGTYIQIVEMWTLPFGRYVLPPGIDENPASAHYSDQLPLAQTWSFFPMIWKRSDLPD